MADEFTKAALYGIKTFNKKVKEKIGMEKLIELLNEWQQNFNPGYEFTYKYSEGSAKEDLNKLSQLKLFIKWLVENDKIDYHKISEIMIESDWRYTGKDKTTAQRVDKNMSDLLLMILSISDTPIEDLILYLK